MNAMFGAADEIITTLLGGWIALVVFLVVATISIIWIIFPIFVYYKFKELIAVSKAQVKNQELVLLALSALNAKTDSIAGNTYASAENSATALKIQTTTSADR